MKKTIIISLIAIISLGGFFLIPQKGDSQSSVTAPKLSMQKIQNDVASGAELLDVRTAEEYAAGHINGARNLPLQNIQAGQMPNATKDKTVYVYCRSGNRSAQAKTILEKSGYTVVDLGAMTAVESLGGKVVKS
jgi:rhodanese-related sulfurtransferase